MRFDPKTVVTAAAGAAVLCAAFAMGRDAAVAQEKPATLADLAWLEGSWRSVDGAEIFDETWLAPEGDSMSAVSREVQGGKTRMYELSTIEATDAGPVLRIRHFGAGLAPWKSEAADTPSWPLASRGDREATFEEPSRGFPRRIVYRREAGKDGKPDVLVAKLDGERGGKPMAMEFRLVRR